MTKFESIGIDFQNQANTIREADRAFAFSCKVCCERGMQIRCDHCMISATHEAKVEAIQAVEEYKRQKEAEKAREELVGAIAELFGFSIPEEKPRREDPPCMAILCGVR